MSAKSFGRLERVELRDIWRTEAIDFTPWLAREENLDILGETLGIDLELEAQERRVGPFRADILCKDAGTDRWVLIENQLERTDHAHLGQLLTYASGLEAVTIIWIAANFTDEHRATLDWLNRITDESFQFFGLEVELWRIGESPAAPKFNIVSKPNDWSRSVAQAARVIDESELSEKRLAHLEYWNAFQELLKRTGGPVSGNRKPQPRSWMMYPIGRSRIRLGAVVMRQKRQVRAEVYLSGVNAKTFFQQLRQQKDDVQLQLGFPLEWEELPDGQESRIAVYLADADPNDEADWPRQHQWLAAKLNALHRAFASRVRALEADDGQADNGDVEMVSVADTAL